LAAFPFEEPLSLADDSFDPAFALSEVLPRLLPRVRRLFFRQRIPPWDGDDLIQKALTAAWRRWPSVAHMEAWLYGTIKKMCIVYWRRRPGPRAAYRLNAVGVGRDQVERQRRRDLLLDIDIQSAKLPRRQRRLLFMRYRLGMTLAEVATEMAICRSHVLRQEQAALGRLRRLMVGGSAAADQHRADRQTRRLPDPRRATTRHRPARGRLLPTSTAALEDLDIPPRAALEDRGLPEAANAGNLERPMERFTL
jgi:RNA polymerase sigma factor (sigma-70 family)